MRAPIKYNPWASMWVRPRTTIQEIVDTNPRRGFWPLSFLYGFPWVLQMCQTLSKGSDWSLTLIFAISLILAIPAGAIAYSFMAWLFHLTGKLFKGRASFTQVRAAVSWPYVTNMATIVTWLILIGTFGQMLFKNDFAAHQFVQNERLIVLFCSILQLVAAVWGFVIFLQALSQVQGYSIWMAILNAILMIIILIAAGYVLALVGNWIYFAGAQQAS
jgi:hypothetical protein